ncbi:uncharacterized protein LOC144166596 [Haemaphysalis longicornis]
MHSKKVSRYKGVLTGTGGRCSVGIAVGLKSTLLANPMDFTNSGLPCGAMRGRRGRGSGRRPGRPRKQLASPVQETSPRRQRTGPSRSCKSPGSVTLRSRLEIVLEAVRNNNDAWLFAVPLDEEMCPGYFSIVKEPMDLTVICERVENGTYSCKEEFVSDFKRMVENCAFYNGLQSEIATKGYRLWVTMLDALHTACCDDDDSSKAGACTARENKSKEALESRLHVPEHVATPAAAAAASSRSGPSKPRTPRGSKQVMRSTRSAISGENDTEEDNDDDDDDFAAPPAKRQRGRPPKRGRGRGVRRATPRAAPSRATPAKNSALEALSKATRKALEDSADLTYDICRLNGDFEANSDVAGYFPDLNVAGTHSHPADLLVRFQGSPDQSGGYTIAESPGSTSTDSTSTGGPSEDGTSTDSTSTDTTSTDGSSTDDSDARSPQVSDDGRKDDGSTSATIDSDSDGNAGPTESSDEEDNRDQSGCSDPVNSVTEAEHPDDDKTMACEGTAEASVRTQDEVITTESLRTVVRSSVGSDSPVRGTSPRGDNADSIEPMTAKTNSLNLTISTAMVTDTKQIYTSTSVVMPPRCRSVPPVRFTQTNLYFPVTAARASSLGNSGSIAPGTNTERAEEAPVTPSIEFFAEKAEVRATENQPDVLTTELHEVCNDKQPGSAEKDTANSLSKDSSDIPEQDASTPSQSAASHDTATPLDDDKSPTAVAPHSPADENCAVPLSLPPREDERMPPETVASFHRPSNVLPDSIKTRERMAVRLPADLQGVEPEFYYGLDSPKSSFSFSSGYLSEDALSPMRFHSSGSPLPQLSPSRLSPLLSKPSPPAKGVSPDPVAQPTSPSKGERREASSQVLKEVALEGKAPTGDDKRAPDVGRCERDVVPLSSSSSPPMNAPTPLQKMSALVADIPSPSTRHAAFFPCVYTPPAVAVSSSYCGPRKQGRTVTTAFKPVAGPASHVGGLRSVPSSCIPRPVPTQPGPYAAQRPVLQQEPVAYFIPAQGGFQALPFHHMALPGGHHNVVTPLYNWDSSIGGMPVPWGCPQVIYPTQPLFLPDVSPEAQRTALRNAPWLRGRSRPSFQQQHTEPLLQTTTRAPTKCADSSSTMASTSLQAEPSIPPPTTTKSQCHSGKATAGCDILSLAWSRAFGTPYQAAPQPVMVAPPAQQRPFFQQERYAAILPRENATPETTSQYTRLTP